MKSALGLLPFCLFLPACGTITDWREISSDPMTIGECYDGVAYVAGKDGFTGDATHCDRGLGTWQSRWRMRQIGLGRPGRYRLTVEVLLDEGSPEKGWPIRYAIEQQKVKDLRNSMNPNESDWSADGQDGEREILYGEKVMRRLAPKRL